VEQNNCLGIHVSKAGATAVLLSANAAHPAVLGCVSVTRDPKESGDSAPQESLVGRLVGQLASAGLRYGEVCVSIDCAMYTQHNLRSDFTEYKQIANTIMFDAEEALARDATEMALTFSVIGPDGEAGSRVAVFTADRALLSTMLSEMQEQNLDPTAIEPDILCLARYLENFAVPKEVRPLFVVFSHQSCYMILPQGSHASPLVRSFIVGRSQNVTSVLQREIPLTLAAMNADEPVTAVFIAGENDALDTQKLAQSTGLDIETIELSTMVGAADAAKINGTAPAEFAMAYGAALTEVKHVRPYDFRRSFAPYQGKRMIMQKTLRMISVMVTITMVALGIYLQLKVLKKANYIAELEKNLIEDYREIMYGANPPKSTPIITKLNSVLVQVTKIRGGELGDESSIPAKLTYMLEAINGTPESIDLNVTSIDLTNNRMSLNGDTNRRDNTVALFNAMDAHPKLQKVAWRHDQKSNRDVFTIDLELTKGSNQ
jgi:hypothetical protein